MRLNALAVEKANPVQPLIARDEGPQSNREPTITYILAYEKLEVFQRAVNMIADDVVQIPIHVDKETLPQVRRVNRSAIKASGVQRLLSSEPNPYQDIFSFKLALVMDLLFDGNAFVYFDGNFLFHLPADKVTVIPDDKEYIKGFEFQGEPQPFLPDEIIHIKEGSARSQYRGVPRLKSCQRAINTLTSMRNFQDNFFKNNAVPGLVLKTQNVLSDKVKERAIISWQNRYNPRSGGKSPLILDGGMEIDKIGAESFRDLDFSEGVDKLEVQILKGLGIPPVLMDGGNNANIRPNHRLYYLETVIPLVRKIITAFERFFGFKMWEDIAHIPALQPELRDQAAYLSSLVNGGIITPDEAREELGKDKLTDDQGQGNVIRIPANVAGSAGDPTEGGRPPSNEDDE